MNFWILTIDFIFLLKLCLYYGNVTIDNNMATLAQLWDIYGVNGLGTVSEQIGLN